MEIADEKTRELVVNILQSVIDDMGGLTAKKLMPTESPETPEQVVEIQKEEGHPEDEALLAGAPAKGEIEIEMNMEGEEVTEEDPELMAQLPRWKKKMKGY